MNTEPRMTPRQAWVQLRGRLLTLGGITVVWYMFFRLLTSGDGFNWILMRDSFSSALAIYLPYRIGRNLTGSAAGGAIISLVILIWMSTWIDGREWLVWLLLAVGYVVDFAPCICALIPNRRE